MFGLRLEVVEAPLLKIEAAVNRDGRVAAVMCGVSLDVCVEAVFTGAAPGYRLEKTAGASAEAAEKTATGAEATLDERRDGRRRGEEEGGWVERLLEGGE